MKSDEEKWNQMKYTIIKSLIKLLWWVGGNTD